MKRIGLIDVDMEARKKCTFPNLALMKLSAWHKQQGDSVEWFFPLGGHYDRVYMCKVFSDEYTPDYTAAIDADEIVRGGSGYAISVIDGREVYDKAKDTPLPDAVEHIMPDYSIYEPFGIRDTAYGFATRGCPRGCAFCHVAGMQGRAARKVADISEFWSGQKNIVLLDPNITACRDYFEIMQQLHESGAWVDFSQGLDARLLTVDKIAALNAVKWKRIHFAWDKPEEDLKPHFARIKEHLTKCKRYAVSCYILTNFCSTFDQDVERVEYIKGLGIQPYVMIYRRETAPHNVRMLQRYANNPYVCWKTPTFADYDASTKNKKGGFDLENRANDRC